MEDNGKKIGFLIGEGIWKWKLEEAKKEQSFPLLNELISKQEVVSNEHPESNKAMAAISKLAETK